MLVYKDPRAAEHASTQQLKRESRSREFHVYRRVAKHVYYFIYYKQLLAFLSLSLSLFYSMNP